MEARAQARYVRITPRKARRVVDLIRGMPADQAQATLAFAPQAASDPIGQVLASAIANAADGMPALGIVAAVLGVIHTMGSITEPPAVLGHLIGGALVGTFMGVLLSYGFVGPTASAIRARGEAEQRYFLCIKAGILACLVKGATIVPHPTFDVPSVMRRVGDSRI